jgi:hypothetical protein
MEVHAELPVQRLGITADNIETSAFHRAFWSECADNDMASMANRTGDLADVSHSVACGGEEMKDSAVMPRGSALCVPESTACCKSLSVL